MHHRLIEGCRVIANGMEYIGIFDFRNFALRIRLVIIEIVRGRYSVGDELFCLITLVVVRIGPCAVGLPN